MDFCSGFEAEPWIRFVLRVGGIDLECLEMWTGYFDDILLMMRPGPDGWSGLALRYHMLELEGEDPRRMEDVPGVLAQWESVSPEKGSRSFEAHQAVAALLRRAVAVGGEVWTNYL